MFQVCLILSIVQGVKKGSYGGIYFMLGASLLGFVAIEIILVSISTAVGNSIMNMFLKCN